MNLFSKDKELILKLTNAALLVWFIGALVFTFNSTLDLFMKEPVRKQNYKEYKTTCYKDKTTTLEEQEKYCEQQYKDLEFDRNNRDFYRKRTLYVALANVVIVGSTLYILNKEKETKKKK